MASHNRNKYLGSGVLIIDTVSSCLLLVHDYTKNYNCCGGFMKYNADDPLCLEKTAKDELYEETRTLMSCSVDELKACPFVDVEYKHNLFRCYIYKTECPSDICQQFEKVKFDENETDPGYMETTSLAYFPLAQFQTKKSFLRIDKASSAMDIDGKWRELHRRVLSVIKVAIERTLI